MRFLAMLMVCAAALAVRATPAFAFPSFSAPVRGTLVFLHVFGAIILVGNIIVSAMWMAGAKRTGSAEVLYFASQTVVRADRMFTVPGIVLILVPGLLTVGPYGGFPGAAWAELALALFIVSGVIWGAVLVRLQRRMIELSRQAVVQKVALEERYYDVLKRWMMFGGIATLLPVGSLFLMVFKPALWGG
ncbi:MAG: DUF2269 family protein [Candidatus Krumholzibacteriia bacterium]